MAFGLIGMFRYVKVLHSGFFDIGMEQNIDFGSPIKTNLSFKRDSNSGT